LNVTILAIFSTAACAALEYSFARKIWLPIYALRPAMWVPRELSKSFHMEHPSAVSLTSKKRWTGRTLYLCCGCKTERLHEPALSANDYVLLYQLNSGACPSKAGCNCAAPGTDESRVEIRQKLRIGPQSCVLEQVTNGIAVRMALLSC